MNRREFLETIAAANVAHLDGAGRDHVKGA